MMYDFYPTTKVLFDKAVALHNSNKPEEAKEIYKEIIDKDPTHWAATHNLGLVLDDLCDFEKALRYLEKSIELDPNNYSGYLNKGVVFYHMGQFQNSLNSYLKAFELNPLDEVLLNNLGKLYYEHFGDEKQAMYYYELCIQKHPYYSSPYYNRGLIDEKTSQELAIKDYSTAITLKSTFTSAYINRAGCYLRLGKYNLAKIDILKATELRYPQYNPSGLVSIHKPGNYRRGVLAYEKLFNAGFFPVVRGEISKCLIISPPVNNERILLKPEEIHISKTCQRLIQKNRYQLRLFADFGVFMDRLDFHYKKEENAYDFCLDKLRNFYPLINKYAKSIRFITVALLDGHGQMMVAGELGILAGNVYQSLTGFHDAPSAGTIQLILLSSELEKMGVTFLDLGVSTVRWNPYKLALGAKIFTISQCRQLFQSLNPGSEKIIKKKGE